MRKEEVAQRKRIPRVSSDNRSSDTPRAGNSRGKSSEFDDKHWDFLDEIEAPLWVDLALECQSGYTDKDDEWFRRSHLFHHFSSKQLISAFADSAENGMSLELDDIPEQCSPKLPPSVSKSRGKGYRRDRLQRSQMFTFSNQNPVKNLNKKSSCGSSGSTRTRGVEITKGRTVELACSSSDSKGESCLTENSGQHDIRTVPSVGVDKFTSNSNFSRKGESSTSSKITLEGSGQQQQNYSEVTSHVLGQTQGFLSALKISLRKSCVTRQASRAEATNRRLSEGQKSSSGKSSIGSSSNVGYDKKILTARGNKDMTSSIRNVRIPVACNQKVHEASLSNVPGIQPHHAISDPKLRSQSFKSPFINQGNTKVKAQRQASHAKVLVPYGVNKQCSAAAAINIKGKALANSSSRSPAGGKENLAGKVTLRQKSLTRSNVQVKKVTTRVPEKSVRTTSVVPKERMNSRSRIKKTGTTAEKVYFR